MRKTFLNLERFYPNFYGKYDFPMIKKQKIEEFEILGFNYAKTGKEKNKFLHFFLDDYQFERVWNCLNKNAEIISRYAGAFSPDFSLYSDFPLSLQIYNTYRNRFCGAYWQDLGINVIPTVSWSDKRSFDFCFEGIEHKSSVAISNVGAFNNLKTKKMFLDGYEEMIKIIEPEKIFIYGREIEELKGNVKYIKPFNVNERIKGGL